LGRRGDDGMVVGFITTYAISTYLTTNTEFESRLGEVYSLQHYVIKFISDLRQVRWFSPGIPVSCTNKTDRRDIVEILLKVTLNTIPPPPLQTSEIFFDNQKSGIKLLD
jgi:hypothetical protein